MLQCTSYIYSYIVKLSKIPQIHVFCTFFGNFENIYTNARHTSYHFKDPLYYKVLEPNTSTSVIEALHNRLQDRD